MTYEEAARIDRAFGVLLGLKPPDGVDVRAAGAFAVLSFRIYELFQTLKPQLKAVVQGQEALFTVYGKREGAAVTIDTARFTEYQEAQKNFNATEIEDWPEVRPLRKQEFLDAGVAPSPLTFVELGELLTF